MTRIAMLVSAAVFAVAGGTAHAQSFADVIVGQWSMGEGCTGPSFTFGDDGTATNPDGEQASYSVTDDSITIVDSEGVSDRAEVVSYNDASFSLQIDNGGPTTTLYRCGD